jgi:pimeloyl-ACP methyl ester carboxylesterase
MLSAVVIGLLLAVPVGAPVEPTVPGDGLVLAPTPVVRSPIRLPEPGGSSVPGGFGGAVGIAVISGGATFLQSRKKRDDGALYVLVHGNGGSSSDFDLLVERLGVTSDRVVAFDYRDVGGGRTSTEASRTASTERSAEALDQLIRGLSVDHNNIYSIHHSKGGAVGVSMIGALDDGSRPTIDGYKGAALLDPAIAGGWLGRLQRLGGVSSLLPDNGGFSVERCTDGVCRDVRENLGNASDVEVIAIRNPDAEVTNFKDRPDGLRVFDLVHDGGVPARFLMPLSPLLSFNRVWDAHSSVLNHEAVSDCITQEVSEPGSCVWNEGRRTAPISRRGGGGGRLRVE